MTAEPLASFRGDAIPGKGEITGGEDAGLGILHVHVVDTRKVADVAREDDEALVFDGSRLRAVAHAHITLAIVGAEGNEDDPRAFIDQPAPQLGEFALVAISTPIGPMSVWITSTELPPLSCPRIWPAL